MILRGSHVTLQAGKPKFNPQNLSKSARRDLTIQRLTSDLYAHAHVHTYTCLKEK